MIFAGIDPGKQGAIAFLNPKDFEESAERMPIVGKQIDIRALCAMIRPGEDMMVGLEKVHAMPGQGVTSMFNFGRGYGRILGMLETLQLEGYPLKFSLVTPTQWKKTVLSGMDWKDNKECAVIFAQNMYPSINLTPGKIRKPHSGIADAVCIAEYMRLQFVRGG